MFLSHSHKDRWIARQCARLIEEAAKPYIEVFLDETDIEGGQSIPESVRTAIRKCDELVVLMSAYSKESSWVLSEIGGAWVLGTPIIAILDKVGPGEMPEVLRSYKAIDLNDFDEYLEQVTWRAKARR